MKGGAKYPDFWTACWNI